MLLRVYPPNKALETTDEGLMELERRLDAIELQEEKDTKLAQANFIYILVSKPGRRNTRQLHLQYDDLPDDPLRVAERKIKLLEKQCQELVYQILIIQNQIKIVMGYENSGDQVTNLEKDKSQVELELRQKQQEFNTIRTITTDNKLIV